MVGERPGTELGYLKVKVLRGMNLAKRDLLSSDPYVVLSIPPRAVKTNPIRRSVDPVWNEELTLTVYDPSVRVQLNVFDEDTFSPDDPMGRAYIDIQALVEEGMSLQETTSDGDTIRVVSPNANNYLVGESKIYLKNGKVNQYMIIRLEDVECGEVELQLQWRNHENHG